jgi:hypothetical protein
MTPALIDVILIWSSLLPDAQTQGRFTQVRI